MWFISNIDYRFYQKYSKWAWVIAVVLLVLVLVAGRTVNGAKRWIYLTETFSFQPSKLVKLLMIICYAGVLTKNRDELGKYGSGFVKHLAIVVIPIGLLILEPHLSASIVIIGIVSIMMIMAGCKFWHFLVSGGVAGVPLLIALIIFSPYRLQRVTTFLNPWSDPTDTGWQVIQSLYAIGSRRLIWSRLR